METTRMDLLVTLDEHYLPQLRVMLTSLRLSHPGVQCRVYLLHRSIPEERLAALESGLAGWGYQLVLIRVDEAVFQDAPVTDRYPQEMYYRLLAALDLFHSLNCPVLAGLSRKTMLWKPLGITPAEAGDATVAADAFALMLGADIIRVHDVKPAVQTCRMFELLRDNSDNVFPNLRYTTNAHD